MTTLPPNKKLDANGNALNGAGWDATNHQFVNPQVGPGASDSTYSSVKYAPTWTSPVDGQKATYSAAKVGLVPANSATDIFTITGAANKIIRITRIAITATTTSATPAALDVLLLKRSTANSAGTSTGSPTPVPHDSANAAVSATVLAYTANPTTGTLVGTALRNQKLFQTLATYTATDFPAKDQITWEFGNRPGAQAIALRGTGQVLAINLNGVTATATASFDIDIEWTEEAA